MFRLKLALRYSFSKINGQKTAAIIICFGVAVAMIAFIVCASMMNGMQSKQLDILRNIESFDLIIKNPSVSVEQLYEQIDKIQVFEFAETPVLVTNKKYAQSSAARMRAFNEDYFSYLIKKKYYFSGSEKFSKELKVSLSMQNSLLFSLNDKAEVTFLKHGKTVSFVPFTTELSVKSFFKTTLDEYDSTTILMDLDTYKELIGDSNINYGIFCNDTQNTVIKKIKNIDPKAKLITWQEYNSTVYSALIVEKAMMYIFLSFIFLIICVSLKNSSRRLIENKINESAILRALGYEKQKIHFVFILQGLFICIPGELAGIIIALFTIPNLHKILYFADRIIYLITGSNTVLSSAAFYAYISTEEVVVLFFAVLFISLFFTYLGCKKTFKKQIMELIS